MNTKTKVLTSSIIVLAIGLVGIWFLFHLTNPEGNKYENSPLGILLGVILIGAYQQALPYAWVYFSRLFLNAVAYGIGCMLWIVPDLLIFGLGNRPFADLCMQLAMGFAFGLFIGLFDVLRYLIKARQTRYNGSEQPVITSFATIRFSIKSGVTGLALLLPDRFLFLSPGSAPDEIRFTDIREVRVVKFLGFPRQLTLVFDEAESATFGLVMPGYWKKRIEEAMNLNKIKNG